jgi:hypothetical protein
MRTPVLFFLLCLLPTFLFADWGANGHRIVAKICYDNLTDKARNAIDEALGDDYLEQVANWPDYIKSERNWRFASPWHYATVQPDETLEEMLENTAQNDKIDHVVEGIELMLGILRGDQSSIDKFQGLMDKNKVEPLAGSLEATALAFLIHFIGDIHQPMHVGKNRDLGGNKIEVLFFSERKNLHSVWDTEIIEHERLSFTEFAAFVEKHVHKKKGEWEDAPVREWAMESIRFREDIYNTLYDYTDDETGLPSFSWNYQHDFLPVVEDRLGAAGYRAAALLNKIYQ